MLSSPPLSESASRLADRFDTRTAAVGFSALGAVPLLLLAYLQPGVIRSDRTPVVIAIIVFTTITVATAIHVKKLSDRQFTVFGSGGMIGVALSAYVIADPAGTLAVISMLSIVPAIAASGSSVRVTVALTIAGVVLACILAIGESAVTVTAIAIGAAATVIVVPVLLIAALRRSVEEATRELARLADTDPLTGLLNRRGVLTHAEKLFRTATATGRPTTVFVVDIDHFKLVNDDRGHGAGDSVLVAVAELVTAFAPPGAVVARVGGDEFVVLYSDGDHQRTHTDPVEDTILVGIRQAAEVTVSIGVLTAHIEASPDGAHHTEATVDRLIRLADQALYTAKTEQRDCIAYAPTATVGWARGTVSAPS